MRSSVSPSGTGERVRSRGAELVRDRCTVAAARSEKPVVCGCQDPIPSPCRETGTTLCVEQLRRVAAEELDAMTPAERADVVTASICRTLDELDPEFRALLIERSDEFQRHLGADA